MAPASGNGMIPQVPGEAAPFIDVSTMSGGKAETAKKENGPFDSQRGQAEQVKCLST